jgi:hypothetical protein
MRPNLAADMIWQATIGKRDIVVAFQDDDFGAFI